MCVNVNVCVCVCVCVLFVLVVVFVKAIAREVTAILRAHKAQRCRVMNYPGQLPTRTKITDFPQS